MLHWYINNILEHKKEKKPRKFQRKHIKDKQHKDDKDKNNNDEAAKESVV